MKVTEFIVDHGQSRRWGPNTVFSYSSNQIVVLVEILDLGDTVPSCRLVRSYRPRCLKAASRLRSQILKLKRREMGKGLLECYPTGSVS